ncbi:MAG: hypothetical protein FWE15_04655 [Actinomycetia bacterium]|nr:hypothetical protein [Actinomycetes bacterium]
MTRTCPVRGCPREIADRFLMCGDHWRMVPRRVQQAVYTAYRAPRPDVLLAAARDAAIQHVNERLEPGS